MKKIIAIISFIFVSAISGISVRSEQNISKDESFTFSDLLNDYNSMYGGGAVSTLQSSVASADASDLLAFADKYLGTRYLLGANGPNRFDCSGFTSYVFRHFGYKLDRRASAQIHNGMKVSKSNVKPGDLVFFNGRSINGRIGHVGIIYDVKDNGTFTFIHASIKGVRHNNSTDDYYARRYMGACRILGA